MRLIVNACKALFIGALWLFVLALYFGVGGIIGGVLIVAAGIEDPPGTIIAIGVWALVWVALTIGGIAWGLDDDA